MAWSAGGRRTFRDQAALKTSRAQGGPPTIRTPGDTWPLYRSCRVASTKAIFHQHLEFASKKLCKHKPKQKLIKLLDEMRGRKMLKICDKKLLKLKFQINIKPLNVIMMIWEVLKCQGFASFTPMHEAAFWGWELEKRLRESLTLTRDSGKKPSAKQLNS